MKQTKTAAKTETKPTKQAAAKPAADVKTIDKVEKKTAHRDIDPTLKITVVSKENPKRPSSGAFQRFALYKTGDTVAKFITKGGTVADVRYDVAHKFIKLAA